MKKEIYFVILILFSIIPTVVFSVGDYDYEVSQIYPFSHKSMGMGNANSAVYNQVYQLFSNPAGLTLGNDQSENGLQWKIGYEGSYLFTSSYSNYRDFIYLMTLDNSPDFYSSDITDILITAFEENFYYNAITPILLTFSIGDDFWNASITGYMNAEGEIYIEQTGFLPEIKSDLRQSRAGVKIGGAIKPLYFLDIDLHFGFSINLFAGSRHRNFISSTSAFYYIENSSWDSQLEFEYADLLRDSGFGYGFDMGLLYEIIDGLNVAIVFRDMYTVFEMNLKNPYFSLLDRVRVKPDIVFGISWTMDFDLIDDWILGPVTIALDYGEVLDLYEFIDGLHIGVELPLLNLFGDRHLIVFRCGFDRYFNCGFSINLWNASINYIYRNESYSSTKKHYLSLSLKF